MSIKLGKRLLIVAGTTSTAIGILGIFVPILPTTPFLLLAAACYMRSSERFYRWLLHNRIFGTYIRNYIEGKGMSLTAKLFTISLLWAGIGTTIGIVIQNLAIRIVLAIVATGVTVHIAIIKTMKKAPTLLDAKNKMTTKEVFDEIAPSWYNFRHRSIFPKELEEIVGRWRGGRLLNVGCGHGPDFVPFKEGFELYGIDISGRMLELAGKYAEKYEFRVNLAQADACKMPYSDDFFDYAIAIATFHHIEGEETRRRALIELKRVLRPSGEVFITVWNKWQPRFWLRKKDILVPWRTKGKTLYRYYHLFSYGELEKTIKKAGFEVVQSYPESRYRFPIKYFSRNVCLLARKDVK
jgi:tRNA (uracil-5-)-methyltransferase TRM9